MKILFVLLIICHFIGLFASPVSQENEYDFEEYEYGEHGSFPPTPDNYYDPDGELPPENLCELPPELDYSGKDFHCFYVIIKHISIAMESK